MFYIAIRFKSSETAHYKSKSYFHTSKSIHFDVKNGIKIYDHKEIDSIMITSEPVGKPEKYLEE